MADFFEGFEKSEQSVWEEQTNYPQWVIQSFHPKLAGFFFDIVEQLFIDRKAKIMAHNDKNVSEILLSQAIVCVHAGKHRNALQNHPMVIQHINKRNLELKSLLGKHRSEKSKERKTKSQIKSERDTYKEQLKKVSRHNMEKLLKSELLISQADALQQITDLKHENSRLRTELTKLRSANIELQARITGLE